MANYNIHFDWNRISTLGKVKILVEQVVGSPSQEAIDEAVANYIEEHPGSISGLSDEAKVALLQIAQKVAYIDENGQDYYDALYNAFYPSAELVGITAVYTQSGTVYDTDSLDSLKADLVVTADYDDGTSVPITGYTLSGTLAEGTSTITVTYSGKTDTFSVTVTENPLPSDYTQVEYVAALSTTTAGGSGNVNTGIIPSGTGELVVRAGIMMTSTTVANAYFVSSTQKNENGAVGFGLGMGGTGTTITAFNGILSSISPNDGASIVGTKYDAVARFTTTSSSITDGDLSATNTGTGREYNQNQIVLFGVKYRTASGIQNQARGRIYYVNITENGSELMNLIPCTRNSDSAIGFYDTVSSAFKTAANLTAGDPV